MPDNTDMISYTYTATGVKLSQALQTGKGGTSTRRDYAGAFVFVNNAPGWVGTPHGRFVYIIDGWQNEFHLRDHLGNTRRVVMEEDTGTLATLQQNHYYPFGMLIPSQSTTNTIGALKDNRYLYNGKELQDDFELNWYVYPVFIGNYGVKFYDAQIARWHSVDPLAEKYYPISPYAYVANNPIFFVDPNGMEIVDKDGNRITYSEKDGWSDNATEDVKIIYAALMLTETGQKQWDKIYNSEVKATMAISTEEAYYNERTDKISIGPNGEGTLCLGVAQTPTKNNQTEISSEPTNIIVFAGSIGKSFNDTNRGLTWLEAIGATAGHEIEHTTDDNRRIQRDNLQMKRLLLPHDRRSVEREPTRIGSQIRKESHGIPVMMVPRPASIHKKNKS
ncbi:MAG: RHS repeat-associated core domain-containing protein [Bacteroidales bacterium]|nr:RHS repeat-associated core domain-containing protein [Bacteroidales bacterium]